MIHVDTTTNLSIAGDPQHEHRISQYLEHLQWKMLLEVLSSVEVDIGERKVV